MIASQDLFNSIDPVKRKFFEMGRKADVESDAFVKVGEAEDAVRHAVRYGFPGQPAVKTENGAVSEGTSYQGPDFTWNAVTYAAGYTVSGEAAEDSRLKAIKSAAALLGRKMEIHRDYLWQVFFGRAFNASYPVTDDGLNACSASHLLADMTTTQSNVLATAAALEEESLEAMLTQMKQVVGDDNMREAVQPKDLIVGSTLIPIANKLYTTKQQVGTANNNDSWVKGQVKVREFNVLVSQTNWFVTGKPYADGSDGLFFDFKKQITFMTDDTPRFWSKFYMALYRAMFGLDNYRLLFGSNAV